MTTNTIFLIIIFILIFEFILSNVLAYLNTRYWSEDLPKEAIWIYEEKEYKKSQAYEKTKHKFSMLTTIFSFTITFVFFVIWWFWILDNFLRGFIQNELLLVLAFFFTITFVQIIIDIPFSYRQTFIIEEKFNFNKSTKKIFFLDIIKSFFVSLLIWFILLSLVFLAYQKLWNNFWRMAWILMSLFSVFIMFFYSTLYVPLFNKQSPLEKWELRDEIENFAKKVDFKLDNIFVIDWSKRSSKANAYFTWFGSKKRIVLYDTLIKDLTKEEIVAVLAHEIWHYKKKHMMQMLIFSVLQTWFMIYLFSIALRWEEVSFALWWKIASFHLWLVAFSLLFTPISIILAIFSNIWSRKNEYAADNFAWKNYDAGQLQSALKKLTRNNLSNLRPHPCYEFFYYSHPTILKRLNFLETLKKK